MTTKFWQAGVADETWKVIVCARDIKQVDDTIAFIGSILFGHGDHAAIFEELRAMNGAAIVDALLAYRASAADSVSAAITKNREIEP